VTNRAPVTIRSWEQLQERIASIVDQLNEDRTLALAAAANPFTALEELGYHVEPGARAEIEDRLRFPPKEATQRKRLRARIFEEAGHPFDLDSAEELRRVLYEELSITPYPDERGCYPDLPPTDPPRKPAQGEPATDPIQVLEGRHPVIEPLLEYRRLDASHPRFASRSAYEAIRAGGVSGGLRALRIRLKEGPGEAADEREETPRAPQPRRKRKRNSYG
jgi:hypothetical protein